MKEVKHRIMLVQMLFGDEFIIMVERLDVHLFIWKQKGRNLKSRFREHIRYIKNNELRSAYALHILNCRHEYGNIDDTMTLLKQINTPTLLLPYEQMYIQSLHHNNELIPEQHLNDHNPMFDFLHSNTTHHNPPDT